MGFLLPFKHNTIHNCDDNSSLHTLSLSLVILYVKYIEFIGMHVAVFQHVSSLRYTIIYLYIRLHIYIYIYIYVCMWMLKYT